MVYVKKITVEKYSDFLEMAKNQKFTISQQIVEAVRTALESTPPDLAADIVDRGVMLTGGGALLGNLDLALREQTGLSISIAEDCLNCVALGTGKSLEYEKQLTHILDFEA